MKVREAPELREQILGVLRRRGVRNDPFVHVSDIQYCLLKRVLRDLWPVRDDDKQTLKFATGKSVHELLEAIREWRMVREVSVEKDGIVGTPDLLGSTHVVEIKSTWKSIRQFKENFSKAAESYLEQAKIYCAMTGLTSAQIDVLCLCGDYTYPLTPDLIVGEAEFSAFELSHQWHYLQNRRDVFQELYQNVMVKGSDLAIREGDPLPEVQITDILQIDRHPFTSVIGYEWECEYCPFLEQCRPPVVYEQIKARRLEAAEAAQRKAEEDALGEALKEARERGEKVPRKPSRKKTETDFEFQQRINEWQENRSSFMRSLVQGKPQPTFNSEPDSPRSEDACSSSTPTEELTRI